MVIVDFKLKVLQDLSLKWLYLGIVCRGTKADAFWVLDFALEQSGITQYKKAASSTITTSFWDATKSKALW